MNSQNIQKKVSMFTLFSTIFLDNLGFSIVIPVIAPLFFDPHASIFPDNYSFAIRSIILGFLIAAHSIAQFFGAPILGGLSDRIGRKKVLLISLAGSAISYLIFGFGIAINNIFLLFLSRIISGFSGGNTSTVMSAIADISDKKHKASNFSMIGTAFALGFIIGPYIGGRLSDPNTISWFNYSTPFWFVFVLTILNLLLTAWKFHETIKVKINKKINVFTGLKDIHTAFKLVHFRTIFFIIFLLVFGFSFFTQFFQVFLLHKFNYSQTQIGDLFAYTSVWIALGQIFINRPLSKRFNPQKVLYFSIILLSISLMTILIPNKAYILFFILPFVAVLQGIAHSNSNALVSNISHENSQGEILGISQSVQSVAYAIPPIISGFIIAINVNLPIIVGSLATALAWAILVIYYNNRKNELHDKL